MAKTIQVTEGCLALRRVRQEQGLSLSKLAEARGVHRATVARWLRGEVRPEGDQRLAMWDDWAIDPRGWLEPSDPTE